MADLKAKTESLLGDLKSRFLELDIHINELKSKTARLNHIDNAIRSFSTSVESQKRKLVDLEDRSRRSNLVVFGITEDRNETEDDLKRKVIRETFQQKLGVKCESVGRIHRLGKGPVKRPVILFFQDFNEKVAVLKNAKKLKGSKIYIQNDYSAHTLKKRKMLWESAKSEKAAGKKVYLVHDKLHVDGDTFIWNANSNQRQKISTLSDQRRAPSQSSGVISIETLPVDVVDPSSSDGYGNNPNPSAL